MGKEIVSNRISFKDFKGIASVGVGGTGDNTAEKARNNLRIVGRADHNIVNGVAGLNDDGVLKDEQIPGDLLLGGHALNGPKQIAAGSTGNIYKITYWSNFRDIQVTLDRDDDVVMYFNDNGEIIIDAPSTPGVMSLTITGTYNGEIYCNRSFPINIVPITNYVNAPSIVSPASGASNLGPDVTFTGSSFGVSGGSDTHAGTDWQLATDASFTNIVASVTNSASNKTSWTVTGLPQATQYYVRTRYKGVSLSYSNWSAVSSLTTKASYIDVVPVTNHVNAPSIVSPASGAANPGPDVTFTGSSFGVSGGSDTHEGTDWQLATDASFTNIVASVTNSASNKTSWSATGLLAATQYYVRTRYKGTTMGYSNWSAVSSLTTNHVNAPSIVSPASGASDLGPDITIVGGAFSVSGGSDTHEGTDWQLATDASFTNIVASVTNSSANKTSWTVTGLPQATQYYVRTRYKGTTMGYSNWSAVSSLTTKASYIDVVPVTNYVNAPSIVSPASGASNLGLDVTFTGSSFGVSGGSDTHEGTDWQLATDASFTNIVASVTNSASNKTSWSVTGLLPATQYCVRTRYKGTTMGYSNWSAVISFTTSHVNAPSIVSPVSGASDLGLDVTITSSAFSTGSGSDTHEGTDWQLATDASFTNIVASVTNSASNKTSWTVTGLLPATQYYVRTRYKGVSLSYSNWSTVSSFTTSHVNAPSIVSPVSGASNQGPDVVINSSAFSVSSGSDTHAGTDWQLATDASFTNIVASVTNSSSNKTSWSVTGLLPATQYYVRTRYKGTTMGYSNWSTVSSFTTKASYLPSTEEAILIASDKAAEDEFGRSVSISGDGTRCIVGAFTADPSGLSSAGKAYIFTRSGSTWTEEAILTASDKAYGNQFGHSVSISGDGTRCIVGAVFAETSGLSTAGKAYIFRRSGSTWTQEAVLTASDATTTGYFGYSVAISGDGTRCIVGSSSANPAGISNAGKAYIFTRSVSIWSQEAILIASDKAAEDAFGHSVSISGDGTRCIVGAIWADPSGFTNAGKAYIFTRSGSTWTEEAILTASDKVAGDGFSCSVSISGDGTRCIVGAYQAAPSGKSSGGKAYIFRRSGSTWTQEAVLTASDVKSSSFFGYSVSIDETGTRCIAGAFGADSPGTSTAGKAYIFTRSGSTWTQKAILTASDKAAYDYFGCSVAISGDGTRCIAAAYAADPSGLSTAGKAYIFA